jgi:two-component system, OmpR family, response regulator ResD
MEALMKILVIDDDAAMTDLLKLLLEPSSSTVYTSNDAGEGIGLVKELSPDIIIVDLMMPDLNGWEVCSQIRVLTQAPIIVLSALDHPGMVARALNAGADDYLIKPVTSNILIAYINKLVRRANADQSISLRAA